MFIIPAGATSIRIRETVPTRNYLAIKNLRGEYYLNGHWVIEFSRSTPIAGTMLYYYRGTEGEKSPETITGRGPTTEPLIIELISQELNQGVEYEYYLPDGRPREGQYWSYGSWSSCSKECGSGYQTRLVFCTIDNEAYPDYMCENRARPFNNQTCNEQQCPLTKSLNVGEWNQCSVTCGGGIQTRRVECMSHDATGKRVVEDSLCETYSLRPVSQQNCNMQQCAKYSVSAWSQCSVTCGSGEQTRDIICMDSSGALLADYMCAGFPKPPSTQVCQMSVCTTRIAWHIGDWGLCSKSCGSGLRERQVICSDTLRNLYGQELCGAFPKPTNVENCNNQPCYSPQVVPSMQDTRGYDNTVFGFYPYKPEESQTVYQRDTSYCYQSQFGCCPDGRTLATGFRGQGCTQGPTCSSSRYGCCQDGVTDAVGPNKEGCPEYASSFPNTGAEYAPSFPAPENVECSKSTYGCCFDGVSPARGANGEGCPTSPGRGQRAPCDLPHTVGPCSEWTARYYYDSASSRCVHFWYGGCHGNSNNFATTEECQRKCQGRQPFTPEYTSNPSNIWSGYNTSSRGHNNGLQSVVRRTVPRNVRVYKHDGSWSAVGVSIDKSDPSTVEGIEGQRVVLPCKVTPPPSSTVIVEWRRDGVPLDPSRHEQQPNGSLLVGPVKVKDSGWLLCLATRDSERDYRYVYLSVSEAKDKVYKPSVSQDGSNPADSIIVIPPRFSIDRSESTLVERRAGQSARLHCTILPSSAAKLVSIQWTKKEDFLNTFRHSQHSDGTLVINNLTSANSGVYTCTASSSQQLEQLQIQLRVSEDLRITRAPKNVQVSQGSVARLPCVASGDNVKIAWSRNGVPVRPDGIRVQVSADGTLILYNVQPADEGSYTCSAYVGTTSVSASAEIRVTKEIDGDHGPSPNCVDEPNLANCRLIVSARLCGHQYYSSFCCASCYKYAVEKSRTTRQG
ncbi:papilin isoform X1 [Trichomycterus rosablanca]|uniref:papilin isoform X1 n=1 Tax=Trichomycterus rosablanca TaxID=2290929 RepID=UPI002F3584B6